MIEEFNLIVIVVHQECTYGVDFIPRQVFAEHPFARVFKRIMNVMEVHVNARLEDRQNLEQLIVNIAARLENMR